MNIKLKLNCLNALLTFIFGTLSLPCIAVDFNEHPEAEKLVAEITREHGLDQAWVEAVIRDAKYDESIIKAITRPAEKFPWYRYRPIFVTQSSAKRGRDFWNRNEATLQQAQDKYGVDAAVIVAIIGVETRYGKITGRHRVIDSLTTLILGYPRRSEFFKKELIEFLKLTEEENLNPFFIRGSYAGAMGIPQFISSSYRNYAVDFNNNQTRNLLTETDDAIGSVANYLKVHGWIPNAPVFSPLISVNEEQVSANATDGLKTDRTYGDLVLAGIITNTEIGIEDDQSVGVVKLETEEGKFEYRAAFSNFYVITAYNRSTLYAMAVAELARLISEVKNE